MTEKNKQKYEKKSYVGVISIIIIISLLSPIIINTLLNIKVDKSINIIYSNDWIGYWGNIIGSIIGAIITLIVLKYTIEGEREQYKETLRFEREKMELENINNVLPYIKYELIDINREEGIKDKKYKKYISFYRGFRYNPEDIDLYFNSCEYEPEISEEDDSSEESNNVFDFIFELNMKNIGLHSANEINIVKIESSLDNHIISNSDSQMILGGFIDNKLISSLEVGSEIELYIQIDNLYMIPIIKNRIKHDSYIFEPDSQDIMIDSFGDIVEKSNENTGREKIYIEFEYYNLLRNKYKQEIYINYEWRCARHFDVELEEEVLRYDYYIYISHIGKAELIK